MDFLFISNNYVKKLKILHVYNYLRKIVSWHKVTALAVHYKKNYNIKVFLFRLKTTETFEG